MYSQNEIDEAVAAGAISADAATALRSYIEGQRSLPTPDEEQFRLITGFNDIFVSIAAAILLFAVGFIGQWIGQRTGSAIDGDGPSFLAPLSVAATSWGLALFFTAKRRMALPSILLLLAFIGSVFAAVGHGARPWRRPELAGQQSRSSAGCWRAVSAAIAAGAAWLHWKRFRVPITVAAGAASVAAIVVALVVAALGERVEDAQNLILGLVLLLGVGTFLFAMWWDSSDRARITRRADVAFWLHLLAAPMIVHPVFTLLGPQRRQRDGRRGSGRHPALRRDRPHGARDRPPRAARLGARLRALRAQPAVRAVRRGRAQRRAHRAGDRLGAADALGLLAPGARRRSFVRCRRACASGFR